MRRIISLVKVLTKWSLPVLGVCTLIFIALSFTDIPYYAYHSLASTDKTLDQNPEYIVVLGGSGMPSPDGLIRTYYAAEWANSFTQAKIVIAHSSSTDSSAQLRLMAKELIIRGIDSTRIILEPDGHNTHSQIVNIASIVGGNKKTRLLLISSPQHMYRSIACFEKLGFTEVGSAPSFERPIAESSLNKRDNEGNYDLAFRYNMWSYMQYEIIVLREYFALAYYKVKGWI